MAGLIPQATLERIRAASDIVEVIGGYVPLKRAGANFVALCPFHKEKTPSFHVHPQRQIFHCFGCHKGGDVFAFVRDYENISFVEAARRLAERARIPLELESGPGGDQVRFQKESLLRLHEAITQRWQQALANDAAGQVARDYLARRQVAPEAVQLFRLGYALEAWDDTVNWAKHHDYDLALVEQAGLILRKAGESRYYDRFRGRLMFPICDEQGRVIGFSGRVLAGDEKTAKYVNSPETPLFTKSKVIFGLDKAKRALLEAGFAVVCEGQLDLIACHTAGVRNTVAPQGTALTADHARILKRYVEEVVLCFDSDAAGQNATRRALDDLLASGLVVRVATVPAPHDPDSFIRECGPAAFRQLIDRAQGFFDFLLDRLCALHDPRADRGRIAIVRGMAEAVLKAGNAVLTDTYAQKTAHRLAVAVEAVRAEFNKGTLVRAPVAAPPAPAPDEAVGRPSPAEFWLLKLLLLDDTLVGWAGEHLDLQWLQHAGVRRVVERRLAAHAAGTWQGVPALLDELNDPRLEPLVTEAVAEQREILNRPRQIADLITRLRDQALDREMNLIRPEADRPELSPSARGVLLARLQALRGAKGQRLEPPPAPGGSG